jgi:hypothetical protein
MVKCGDQNNWFVDGGWRTLTQVVFFPCCVNPEFPSNLPAEVRWEDIIVSRQLPQKKVFGNFPQIV